MSEPNDVVTIRGAEHFHCGNHLTVTDWSPKTGLSRRRYERVEGKWVEQEPGG